MKISKHFKLAANIVVHSKLRSWLTILGIVIGIASVVSLVSIGAGLQQSVTSNLQGLGADIISISPGGGRAMMFMSGGGGARSFSRDSSSSSSSDTATLSDKDVFAIRGVSNVEYIEGVISQSAQVYYLSEKTNAQVEGVDPVLWQQMSTSTIDSGRALGPSDANSVVIGYRIAQETFKQPLLLNSQIVINGKNFNIVGILSESAQDDNRIIMPIKTARTIFTGLGANEYSSILVKASSVDAVDQVTTDIDNALMLERHVTTNNKDYSIISAKSIQAQISTITDSITAFLGSIAAIALLVGGVGIANTLFTTVLEKTKEIGVMKAIGAKNEDILKIFLLYSMLVGLVGGLLGIFFGVLASSMLPYMMSGMASATPGRLSGGSGIQTLVTPDLLIFVLALSLIIGVVSGVIPAMRAAKLKPVKALRYE